MSGEMRRRDEEKPTKSGGAVLLFSFVSFFKSPHTITSGLLRHGVSKLMIQSYSRR